ncbi:hypothetical protein [Mesorhizobium sp. Cs1299R1N3]|uniref:hypothetical protein n=1 Tax=Mesorhizobium sp. Cs1299R1N3 TaxID=3015173 RepID=UPI00301C539C
MLKSHPHASPPSIPSQYASWFDDRIEQFIEARKGKYEPTSFFKGRNGFFITISFDHSLRKQRLEDSALVDGSGAKTEMDTFQDLYNVICRILIGRNYHRPSFHDLKPLAIGCLDVNGSRYWRSMGELENAHIHSIWIFTDQTTDGFRTLLADKERLASIKERFSIRELDVQQLDHDHRNSTGDSRASSYMAKFMVHNNHELKVADDFRVLPFQVEKTLN